MSSTRLAFELARWALGFLLLWRMPKLATDCGDDGADALAGVSVIVPARNEEENLRHLLPSIVPQAREVVVVDDGSTDATAEVARSLGATVVEAGERPMGWAGKPWACHQGVAAAQGDVLVFLDADVEVEAGGLERLARAQREEGDLVSLQPFHTVRRPYEHLSLFPNLIALMGVGAFTIVGRRLRPRGAFGPCLAIGRAAYDAIGGHAAVRGEVVEDVALAQRAEHVTLFGGRGVVRYRMYPDGPRSLIEGWVKNLASGAKATHPLVFIGVMVWLSGVIQSPLTSPWLYLLFAVQIWWLTRDVGDFGPLAALLHVVALVFFLCVFSWSIVATFVVGRVTWRGRTIRLR